VSDHRDDGSDDVRRGYGRRRGFGVVHDVFHRDVRGVGRGGRVFAVSGGIDL
jgi:hypothetical protein